MNEQTIEDIISALYDMVQDARAVPLAADKCIVERDKVLDMLDEIIAQMPVELKQALIGRQGHCTCVLHHIIQRGNDILNSLFVHFLSPP